MKLYIVPNLEKPGRWALRWEGDTFLIGNFATPDEAKTTAGVFANAEIVMPPVQTTGTPAAITRSVDQRLADLAMPPLPIDRTLPLPLVREVVSAH